MSQTTRALKLILTTALLLLLAGIVMACNSTPQPVPRPDAKSPAEVEVAVVPPPTPSTSSEAPTPPPAIMAPDDGCVECHTSEETLKATAEEEEGGESLSEGEG